MSSSIEDNSESTSMSEISFEEEKTVRKRGRPRKFENRDSKSNVKFGSMLYESPLGFQYMQQQQNRVLYMNPAMQRGFYNTFTSPPNYNTNYYPHSINTNNFGYPQHNLYSPPAYPQVRDIHISQMKIKKQEERPASVVDKRPKRQASIQKKVENNYDDEEEEEEYDEEEEEDLVEKLLAYDEEKDSFLVKFRYQSYLHCDYVKKEDIAKTKSGAIKVKRFRKTEIPFDPEYIKVDRVLHEEYKDGKIFIIKWKKLPYELATEEKAEDVTKCEFFEEELKNYRDRKKMRTMRYSLEWRPPREMHRRYEKSPEFKDGNSLRSYQLEGLNWLLNRWYFKVSCIMADEMGLGKTVQSVTFINTLFTEFEYVGPVLIVAPLSTLVHWEREFKAWTDLRVLTYHGSIQGRNMIANYEFFLKTNNLSIRLFDVLITTYEMVMAGFDHLSNFNWAVGIFDEAHRLKNANSKASVTLRGLNFSHKVLLTGTPLQNNITELWALLYFINPHEFSNSNDFLNEYKLENSVDVEKLQSLLRPLMLRRMKEDVEKTIPMKEETIIEVELTMIQKRFYRAILEKNMEFLTKGGKDSAPNLLNAMMELRKCCIHPYLIKGAEEKILGDYLKRKKKESIEPSFIEQEDIVIESGDNQTQVMDNCNSDIQPEKLSPEAIAPIRKIDLGNNLVTTIDEYYKILIQSSGKLVLLDKLLNKLNGKHKVLIFSQMTRCLDLLADYLTYRKYKFERIDGGVRGENRQAAIDRFSDSNSDVFVFLLCTRAGGVGINLTAADTVVIFDSDWNPQNDLQAQARCHRIGQINEVKIYRLVTRNTYEREMFDKAGLKLGLDKAVLQKMSFEGHKNEKVKKKDAIELLLKKGAYGVLMETDEASRKFCEEDIDQILERRTKVIKHSDGGNVFSKATFQVDEEIDDPDFWDNLLNKKKNEENEGRIKRQMRRLAREDNISNEELEEINGYLNLELNQNNDVEISETQCLLIFLKLICGGLASVGLTFNGSSICEVEGQTLFKDPLQYLKYLVKYNIDQIQNTKIRLDFSNNLEEYLNENYDPMLFEKYKDVYAKYGEKFILRLQVLVTLKKLLETEELNVEKTRGWTQEDDNLLISSVFANGYANYPNKIRNKSSEESNQRLRKIILSLSRRKEMAESDILNYRAIMRFGRVTELNEDNVLKFLEDRDISSLKEAISKVESSTKRLRNPSENECSERIFFFDRLFETTEIPAIRRVNMPRGWTREKDIELRNYLLENGLHDLESKFDIGNDLAIKRFESIFKNLSKQSGD